VAKPEAVFALQVSGCELNAPVQNLILPLAACEHLGTIKAANSGLRDELPSLDPMPPTKVDRDVRLGKRSYLAKSLETLDLSGAAPVVFSPAEDGDSHSKEVDSRRVEGCHSF